MPLTDPIFSWQNIQQQAHIAYEHYVQNTLKRGDYDPAKATQGYWLARVAHDNAIAAIKAQLDKDLET